MSELIPQSSPSKQVTKQFFVLKVPTVRKRKRNRSLGYSVRFEKYLCVSIESPSLVKCGNPASNLLGRTGDAVPELSPGNLPVQPTGKHSYQLIAKVVVFHVYG